jgi:hypothetical protein
MRSDVFIANLARGAVAASVAGGWMLPQKQTEAVPAPQAAREEVCANVASLPEEGTDVAANQTMVLTITQSPSAWDKRLEKEFRSLALVEGKGALSPRDGKRLNELTQWRNRLLHGQTSEEISLQLKRDRLLDRMESLLREYVEFQETANQKRATA